MANTGGDFPTIEQLFGRLQKTADVLSAADIAALVNGWNHTKPATYQASSDLTYEDFSGPAREAFDAARKKLLRITREEFLEEGGSGEGRMSSVFGLTPRDATKFALKGGF